MSTTVKALIVGAGCLVFGILLLGFFAVFVVPKTVDKLFVSQIGVAQADIMTLCQALDSYAIENRGRYPETLDELWADPSDPYIDAEGGQVLDPWGQPYQYRLPKGEDPAEVWSFGADGVEGGTGPAADLRSSDIRAESRGR